MHLTALHLDLARPPGGDGPAVAAYDGVVAQPLAQLPGDYLGLHGLVGTSAALFHQLPPVLHAGLRRLQKTAVLFTLQVGGKPAQRIAAVAYQADLHRVAEPDALG